MPIYNAHISRLAWHDISRTWRNRHTGNDRNAGPSRCKVEVYVATRWNGEGNGRPGVGNRPVFHDPVPHVIAVSRGVDDASVDRRGEHFGAARALTRSTTRRIPLISVSPTRMAFGPPSGTRWTFRPVKRPPSDRRAVHAGMGPGVPWSITSRVHAFVELPSVPSQASLESAFSAYTRALRRGWSALGCTVRAGITRHTTPAPASHGAPDQRASPATSSSSGASRSVTSDATTHSAIAPVPTTPSITTETP